MPRQREAELRRAMQQARLMAYRESYAIPCRRYRATELERKGLDPILDPNSPELAKTQRHRLVCQNSKSADKIKTNDTSQHTM
jgi:hypothetical protein